MQIHGKPLKGLHNIMNGKRIKKKFAIIASLTIVISMLFGCRARDPYEGMVQVPNGSGGQMWITVNKELEVSSFSAEEFLRDGEYVDYTGSKYSALRGIDVSEHQLEIDWEAVRSDGVEFAVIRAGYRGYSTGALKEDIFFRQNIEGALDAGLKVGVYFFSQAINSAEAKEEAQYLLNLIEGCEFDLPVFFDWEHIGYDDDIRTKDVSGAEITDFALAFCNVVTDAGYDAGVYFYRSLGYNEYDLGRLNGLVFWSAAVGEYPDFYYAHAMWQYSYTAKVSGIETDTDLNILFEKLPDTGGGESG